MVSNAPRHVRLMIPVKYISHSQMTDNCSLTSYNELSHKGASFYKLTKTGFCGGNDNM